MPSSAPSRLAIAAILFWLGVLYASAFGHALETWRLDPELSFGFFGPPVAALMLAVRLPSLRRSAGPGSRVGLAVLIGGLLLAVAGRAAGVSAVVGASLLPVAVGAAAYLFGYRTARSLLAPVSLLGATLSVYRGLFSSVGFALQQLTAGWSAGLAAVLGVPVRRSGVDLFVGGAHFVIAQACSGMDSLLALLYLGLVVAAFATAPLASRLLLFAAALPIALAMNILRVTAVLLSASGAGLNLEAGALHPLLSGLTFLLAGIAFSALVVLLRCVPRLRVF